MKTDKTENRQTCLFCIQSKAEMPVYSCGLGRIGICLECVEKARTALLKHLETYQEGDQVIVERGGSLVRISLPIKRK
jgi:hypothetical protein